MRGMGMGLMGEGMGFWRYVYARGRDNGMEVERWERKETKRQRR